MQAPIRRSRTSLPIGITRNEVASTANGTGSIVKNGFLRSDTTEPHGNTRLKFYAASSFRLSPLIVGARRREKKSKGLE
jgi:hypothetical protein